MLRPRCRGRSPSATAFRVFLTQLYESLAMALAAIVLGRLTSRPHRERDVFKLFMTMYFGLRLAVDAIKPKVRIVLGLSSLQWASVAVLLYYGDDVRRWILRPRGSRRCARRIESGG